MTVHLKNNAVGIDAVINAKMQSIDLALSSWELQIYGRLYKHEDNRPMAKILTNTKEYKRIFLDDKVNNVCGFIVSNNESVINGGYANVDVDIVFTINLNSVEAFNTGDREDELAKLTAYQAVNNSGSWKIKKVKKTITEVFQGYNNKDIEYRDYHPWFTFSFSCTVKINLQTCLN